MVVEKEKKLNVVILLKVSDKCRYFLKRGVLVFAYLSPSHELSKTINFSDNLCTEMEA